ncbi:MAG: glycerate kinase [Propionibacteriaceae bacterium]|nr:glycerate kinase [Propionibacteriaceae bacterium]
MRVVVSTDVLAALSPREASETIARAFADRGAQVAVVPLGVDGERLAAAVSAAAPAAVFSPAHTSEEVGEALAGAALPDGQVMVLDLTAVEVSDLGRAALALFGPNPVGALAAAQEVWAGRRLVALVPDGEQARPLTGLEGHASTVLRAAGATLQEILTFDAGAEKWAAELGLEPGPGAGAAGGVGLLIQALGGRVVDPLTWLGEQYGILQTMGQADLVVTGAELMDFHERGGPVVKRVVAWAEEALRPVIAVTSHNFISARELRVAGLENSHAMLEGPGDEPGTPEQLAAAAGRVADSWIW